jgi:hypothetical protein
VPAAFELWRTCDPVPRTRDAWDEALASGRAGALELSSNPETRLRIDGRDYGIRVGGDARVTRVPTSPGMHTLDFLDDAHVVAVRRQVLVRSGETTRVVLEQRDRLPKPAALGNPSWYVGRVEGRPFYTNVPQDMTVAAVAPKD